MSQLATRRSGSGVARLCCFFALLAAHALPGGGGLPAAGAAEPPRIDVYTMGPGDDLFSRFGHAAICVTDEQSPLGRCYNYGTADFSTPGPLTFSVLRGRAVFWVSVVPLPRMLALYAAEDRTVWRQRLPLEPAAAAALATRLHAADVKAATYYYYHHFNDNCTTRIRDLVDDVTAGSLRRDTQAADGPPLRRYVHDGFAGQPLLLALTDLLLGRVNDRATTRWQAMFLPEMLRAELQTHLHSAPEVVYARRQPLVMTSWGPWGPSSGGSLLLVPLGLVLLGGVLGLRALGRWRLAAALTGGVLGLLGVVVFAVAAVSALPELRYNEAALLCLPTDLLLLALPAAQGVRYARLRLLGLLLAAAARTVGLLVQPLGPLVVLCALPLAGLALPLRPQGTA